MTNPRWTRGRRVLWRIMPLVLATIALACSASDHPQASASSSASAATAQPNRQDELIDHLLPRRDSVGPTPMRFTWTPIKDADFYVMAVWNDADVLVYRRDDLPNASVDWPPGTSLEAGTYFWSVAAFRDDRPVAESGRAAFVVMEK